MLVLTRKQDDQIVIDGDIVITVVRLSGGAVKLGIDAPMDVSIKRKELLAGAENCSMRHRMATA
jgi:carbon storage regulator